MIEPEASARLVRWTGVDDPDRIDVASVTFAADSLAAHGTSTTTRYSAAWSLETGADWRTERVSVSVHGDAWSRQLELTRSREGRWSSTVRQHGDGALPRAGIADPDALHGAVDCDLALCPLTNTMPIRRLDLLAGSVPEQHLVMAWIDLPSLQVVRSDQVYASLDAFDPDRGYGVVTYRSYSRDFTGLLTVDRDGIVIDYPSLAKRMPA